jgi:hypothetical protein
MFQLPKSPLTSFKKESEEFKELQEFKNRMPKIRAGKAPGAADPLSELFLL